MKRQLLLVLLMILFAHLAHAGGESSSSRPVGLSVAVETDGMLGGRVTRLVVTKVAFGSQAKAAGVQEGDEVVSLHGMPVRGLEAKLLKLQMSFQPDETKLMTLRRNDGSMYEVSLTQPGARR